jgi:hypothetical protein
MLDSHSLSSFSGRNVNNGGNRKDNTEVNWDTGHAKISGLKTEFISDLQIEFGSVCASENRELFNSLPMAG